MLVDIPIRNPYTTGPNMNRYSGPVISNPPNDQVIKQKQQELARWASDLYGIADIAVELDLVRRASLAINAVPTDNIVDLALQFEEDIAILHRGTLAAICFCFPSSWVPAHRVGLSLSMIHQPVADGELLVRASSRIAETIATSGPYRRHVWTIATSSDLNQHPENKKESIPTSVEDLHFRTETQTTMPLGDGLSSLFFVRIETCPLQEIWPTRAQEIIDSVNSMSDAVLDYKNLRHIKNLINS